VWATYLFSDPTQYLEGLRRLNQDHPPDHRYFLMGEYRTGGWWYYFAAAFVLKTPLPTLFVLAGAALHALRDPRSVWAAGDAVLLVPAAAFFAATSAWADDLGIRYLLPVYPLLFVFAGRLAAPLLARRTGQMALAALGAWLVVGTLRVYPDDLAYFNEAAGGPSKGYLHLDDSNVDWGQDLKRLKAFVDTHHIGAFKLCMHQRGFPPYYGLQAEPLDPEEMIGDPPPGVYAASTHCLARLRAYNEEAGRELDWAARFTPLGRVGQSFYVFEIQ
jgi:hypothetical protein